MYGVVLFDMTVQYIFVFFLLVYCANYINFLAYNVLIRNVKTAEGPHLKLRTNPYFITMNVVYVVNAALAATEWYGPWCNINLYPPCMSVAAGLYWANYFYHLYLNKHDYFLAWDAQVSI
jgi:hypothetical protein